MTKTSDPLVDKADVESDRKKRAQLYIRAQHLALGQGAFISMINFVDYSLIKPYVHGLVGTEVYIHLIPKNYDWANVSVDPH